MCFAWKNECAIAREEPTLDEWQRFINFLSDLSDNAIEMNFSGAEPLCNERSLALIGLSALKGLPTSLATNGVLIDRELAKKIVDSGLSVIVISLDGIKKDTHDFLRGVDGCYDKVMRAIDYLDSFRSNLKIGIQAIIMERNLDEIIELVEWANGNKKIDYMSLQVIAQPFYSPFDGEWYKKTEHGFLWPKDIGKVHSLIEELVRLKQSGYKISNPIAQLDIFKEYFARPGIFVKKNRCNVDFWINVNRFGDMRMCESMEQIGNIRQDDLRELWYSERAIELRERMRECRSNCHLLVNCACEDQ